MLRSNRRRDGEEALPALFVHRHVLDHLLGLRAAPWEVGGWLLGYWSEARRESVVTHATPPGPRGTPFRVHISGRGHRPLFDAAWERSQGHVTFAGDWHTHPGGPDLPSDKDRQAARELANNPDFRTPRPLIAIVANPKWLWSKTEREVAWYVGDGKGRLRELPATVFDDLPPAVSEVPAWDWPHRLRSRGLAKRSKRS